MKSTVMLAIPIAFVVSISGDVVIERLDAERALNAATMSIAFCVLSFSSV
jgi:hypothetical protein